jgi:hypothetical protein
MDALILVSLASGGIDRRGQKATFPYRSAMDEETRTLLRERFQAISNKAWKGYHPKYGAIVKFKTAAWTYAIVETYDGLAIQPENTSRKYVDYVELLLDCLIELAHTKSPIANDDRA